MTKALSINQPWAWAILHAGKDIENRDWQTYFRGRFLIHAGLRIDEAGFGAIETICGQRPPDNLPTGGIIGAATLTDCVHQHDYQGKSPWFFGSYGFVLTRAEALPFRPCVGALGFFEPDYSKLYKKDRPKTEEPKNPAEPLLRDLFGDTP